MLFVPARLLLPAFLALCGIGLFSILLLPVFFPANKWLTVLPNYNFFALGLGSLLALREAHPRAIRPLLSCSAYSLGVFVVLTAMSAHEFWFRGMSQLKYCSLVIAFFWLIGRASCGFSGPFGKLLELTVFVYLGRISYGLYLFHAFADYPLDLFCRKVMGVTSLPLVPGVGLKAIGTVIAATISWHVLERPMNSLKRWFPYQRQCDAGKPPKSETLIGVQARR